MNTSSGSGKTATVIVLVCNLPVASVAGTLCTRWTPTSNWNNKAHATITCSDRVKKATMEPFTKWSYILSQSVKQYMLITFSAILLLMLANKKKVKFGIQKKVKCGNQKNPMCMLFYIPRIFYFIKTWKQNEDSKFRIQTQSNLEMLAYF